jgi:hypothetical protein
MTDLTPQQKLDQNAIAEVIGSHQIIRHSQDVHRRLTFSERFQISALIEPLIAATRDLEKDSTPSRNVPKGLYRNSLGAELHVVGVARHGTGWPTLSGDIAIAEDRDELFGTSVHLVTEASLKDCGYELIEPADG